MNAREAITHALKSTSNLLKQYVSDLSDADLLVRPVPGANHIAWQLGHLISGEVRHMTGQIPGVTYPELPAGFVEQHDKAMAGVEPAKGFRTKEEYLGLFSNVRRTTMAGVERLSDADFDKPNTGTMAKFAPTLGFLLLLQANHVMMHAGQFTVVRRKLGKPILM
jgi:hypothetical protein